jgi:hypothetical protein
LPNSRDCHRRSNIQTRRAITGRLHLCRLRRRSSDRFTKLEVQRAFLAGVSHGYRLGRKETKRDVEDLWEELKEAHDAVRAELTRRQATDDVGSGGELERDPETRLARRRGN